MEGVEASTPNNEHESESFLYALNTYENLPHNASSKSVFLESLRRRIWTGMIGNKLNCKYCYYPWSDGNYTMKVLSKKTPGKRISKLLKKKQKSPEKLTKFEKNLIKYIEQDQGNKLVLTCLHCKQKTKNVMHKSKNSIKSSNKKHPEVLEEKKGKKKKKKKDSFAGLKQDIFLKSNDLQKRDALTSQINFKNKKGKSCIETPSVRIGTSLKKKTSHNSNLDSSQLAENKKEKNNSFIAGASKNTCEKKVSFLEKLDMEVEREHNMKKEIAGKNKQKRKVLKLQMKKSKPNLTDFKNFLRDFGKPV